MSVGSHLAWFQDEKLMCGISLLLRRAGQDRRSLCSSMQPSHWVENLSHSVYDEFNFVVQRRIIEKYNHFFHRRWIYP